MSHTPGPWKSIVQKDILVIQGPDGLICSLLSRNLADGSLIVASPDLLRICKELLLIREKTGLQDIGLTRELREIIGKAEGK